MRCPDCNKFVAQETGDPEINVDLDVDTDPPGPPVATFDASAHLAVVCADCGTDLKETDFEFPGESFSESAVAEHVGDGHELEAEVENEQATERFEGSGRGQRHFYGVEFDVVLRCKCRDRDVPVDTVHCTEEIQASQMDELA